MTSYTAIANGDIDQDSPVTQPLVTALRDNPIAIAEGSSGAPVMTSGWHPYDMVNMGDANDGAFYDFAVDGALASVVTPTFVDGYEYTIRWEAIVPSSTANFQINSVAIHNTVTTGNNLSGYLHIPMARVANLAKYGWLVSRNNSTALDAQGFVTLDTAAASVFSGFWSFNSAAALSSVSFSFSSGNINAGKFYLYRRRFTLA